jgi:1-acyl-sn-glycerol-3-phosphate acyltransferase
MAIMKVFPGISWFGRERLLKIPLFGRVLKMIDYIPMKSGNIKNTRQMISQLILNSNTMTIAIFPEGTRTLQGQLNRFHKGFIYVLKAADHDILPVTLNGFYSLKPKPRMAINFSSKLEMIIHDPIENKTLKNKSDVDIITHVKDVIESVYIYDQGAQHGG